MANNKEQQIDVIDPSKLNAQELRELDNKTTYEKAQLEADLKKVKKQIKGKLQWWFILPIFGFIIYLMVYQNRLQKEENQEKTVLLTRQIAEKEIQLMLDKKRWEELDKKTDETTK